MPDADKHDLFFQGRIRMGGIYSVPGGDYVVELKQGETANLYDRQGLQYRIVERRRAGLDTSCEELALGRISTLQSR